MLSKEFEAIRDDKLRIGLLGLKRVVEANAKKMTKDEIMAFDFTFMNITKALTELKQIKESNPSEAMKILLKAKQERLNFYGILLDNDKIFFETLEQALLKAQEDKVIADFIREHYKLSNDINKDYLELKKPITMEEHNKFKENL